MFFYDEISGSLLVEDLRSVLIPETHSSKVTPSSLMVLKTSDKIKDDNFKDVYDFTYCKNPFCQGRITHVKIIEKKLSEYFPEMRNVITMFVYFTL